MTTFRIALANLAFAPSPEAALAAAEVAVADAGRSGAELICFPEAFLPGYRGLGHAPPAYDPELLARAWGAVDAAAARARVTVVLGTERRVDGGLRITARVTGPDGMLLGWQDKVQLDPSEDATYAPGVERRVFSFGPLTFGVAICHEGWRYPETVRWAARRGARLVLHPHLHEAEPGSFRPASFGDPRNSFHEKAALCRAAENGCWFATVNFASEGSPTTSAVVRPDGTLLCHQPYGTPGLLVADLDLDAATLLLASRLRTEP
jgi:predicted amidohydrolase